MGRGLNISCLPSRIFSSIFFSCLRYPTSNFSLAWLVLVCLFVWQFFFYCKIGFMLKKRVFSNIHFFESQWKCYLACSLVLLLSTCYIHVIRVLLRVISTSYLRGNIPRWSNCWVVSFKTWPLLIAVGFRTCLVSRGSRHWATATESPDIIKTKTNNKKIVNEAQPEVSKICKTDGSAPPRNKTAPRFASCCFLPLLPSFPMLLFLAAVSFHRERDFFLVYTFSS